MHSVIFQVLLWVAPHGCLAAVLFLLLSRRRYTSLPFFFVYALFTMVHFLLMFGVYLFWFFFEPGRTFNVYYIILTIGSGVGTILQFGALYELASKLLFSVSNRTAAFRKLVQWVAAALLLLAAGLAAALSQPGLHRFLRAFQSLEFSASLISIGLLLALLLFTSVLGVSWKSLPAGLAVGFGVWSSAEMSALALLSVLGKPGYLTIDMIRAASFLVCTIVWLAYLLGPEPRPKFTGKGLQMSELELLDQKLQRMIQE